MRRVLPLLLILLVLMLAAPVGALTESELIMTSDTEWLIAGEGQATITLSTTNTSVTITQVNFLCADSDVFGEVEVINDKNAPFETYFSTTRSGTAHITATVWYYENGNATAIAKTYEQKIDHNTPYRFRVLEYDNEVTVNETTEIRFLMVDRYTNPVDNRRVVEYVDLFSSPSDGGFWQDPPGDFSNTTIRVPVTATGVMQTTFKAATTAGENIIYLDAVDAIPTRNIILYGIANAPPVAIAVEVDPAVGDPPYVPADGTSRFYLTYTLTDAFGNPSGDRLLDFSTTLGETYATRTNSNGQIMISYGPQEQIGVITITAVSADNASVSAASTVEFRSTEAAQMVMTAVPEVMASIEVNAASQSTVRAKVMDVSGNPVEGEEIRFDIRPATADYSAAQVTDPYLVGADGGGVVTSYTDETGYANATFIPGEFLTSGEMGFDQNATSSVRVRAEWYHEGVLVESLTKMLTWKNYPYLSISTTAEPETVAVGGNVSVTIRMDATGFALQPNPIDVVLVIDRSGSMGGAMGGSTRMQAAINAANDFVDQMDMGGRDRIGLVSFAFDATRDRDFTDDAATIKSGINALYPTSATNMRIAFKESIQYIKDNGRPDAVKAVILMSDGDWNYHGSPLAKGTGYYDTNGLNTQYQYYADAILSAYPWSGSSYSFSSEKYEYYNDLPAPKGNANTGLSWYRYWPIYNYNWGLTCSDGRFTNQNMSVYANSGSEDEQVRVYTIGFASDLNDQVEDDLQTLSESTDASYTWAGDEEQLSQIYTDIAGELQTDASVDTTMDLNFQQVEHNSTWMENDPLDPILEYVAIPGISTTTDKWNATTLTTEHSYLDQSGDWGDRTLHFEFDTIHIDEWLEVKFTLRVNRDGNINVFGNGSTISFNGTDGPSSLNLPSTFVTAVANLTAEGVNFQGLEVSDLHRTDTGIVKDAINTAWYLNYTGNNTVTQKIYYQRQGDNVWVPFGTIIVADSETPFLNTSPQTNRLDSRLLQPGFYTFRVRATALDTPDSVTEMLQPIEIGNRTTPFIRLE